MARRGVAALAVAAVLVVVLAGAAVFGYMYLLPASQQSTTTETHTSSLSAAQTEIPASQGNVVISNAALSNDSLLLTIQNTGSQAVSLDALLITPGTGCSLSSLAGIAASANQTSGTNQTRTQFALPACMTGAASFLVQSNSTLTPIGLGRFNFTSHPFNFSSFNSTSFTRSFSRSSNFSRTISGNFSGFPGAFIGNFSGGFPGGFLGNFSGDGLQIAAGQSVTLAYSGPIGSGVTAGSQYTIMVSGQQAEAQITISAS
jgi:hypothetical protein